ncbi:MAG: hypothetical protein AAGM22_08100 [Acidobacteriota bacterium]
MSETLKRPTRWISRVLSIAPSLGLLAAALAIFLARTSRCGDSPAEFRRMGLVVAAAFAASLAAALLPELWVQRLRRTCEWLVGYFLAYVMMGYGWAKLLDVQFSASPTSFDTRLVDMSPMQVAWAFFGYSYTYQAFAGLGEVAGAFFLCFRRTRTLGACILLAVLSNVVLINIYYGVCVKLNSSVYLLMTLYFLALDGKRLWLFFMTGRSVPAADRGPGPTPLRLLPWLKAGQILALLLVLVHPPYEVRRSKAIYTISESSPLFGAWRIESITVDGASRSAEELWGQPWNRLFIERGLWGTARGEGDVSNAFDYVVDENAGTLELNFRKPRLTLEGRYGFDDAGGWRIELDGSPAAVIELERMPEFRHERK